MPGPANALNISQSGITVFDGTSSFVGRTLQAGSGISITNGNGVSGDPVITSTAATTDLHTAKYIVSSAGTSGTGANYTTITAAVAAAQATGQNSTIFIQPGTYSENITLPANINLAAYDCDALTPNVTISGKITCTDAGSRSISGIRLSSNGAEFLSVTGTVATVVNLKNCYLTTAFDPGITFSSTSASAAINIYSCQGNISASAKKFFAHSSAGTLAFEYSTISNSGASTTASTCSAGNLLIRNSTLLFPITTSATGTLNSVNSQYYCENINATALTLGGATGLIVESDISSGTASAASISSTFKLSNCSISSSNANALTGAGTLNHGGLIFTSTSSTINSTLTQTYQPSAPISFDGTNALANYATGTWTPALTFGGGSTGLTYALRSGFYSRIGNVVYISANLSLSAKGSSTGVAAVSGLPFSSGANGAAFVVPIPLFSAITIGGFISIFGQFGTSNSAINLLASQSAGATANLTDANFANNSAFEFTGFYIIV